MKIRIYKVNTIFLYVCNTTEELYEMIETLYKTFDAKCYLYVLNKRFYLLTKTSPNQNFIKIKYYVKGLLEEYAKLLSADAINEIGKTIKTS